MTADVTPVADTQRRITILAGGGDLPREAAYAAREAGHTIQIISIAGEANLDNYQGFETAQIAWGELSGLLKRLESFGARDVVFLGAITKRPDFSTIKLDWGGAKNLKRILSIVLSGGDSAVLKGVAELMEEQGYRVVGVHDIAPALLAGDGPLAGKASSLEKDRIDVDGAMRGAVQAGRLDMGQGAVCVGGRMIALEGAEGTDAMLERVAELRSQRRYSAKGRQGVLAKCARPGQDQRIDLPTIGPRTVESAVAAGLAGIVVEASRVLIADRPKTTALASTNGLFVIGCPRRQFDAAAIDD